MEKIKSFEVNHEILEKGLYLSRIDENSITYDLRIRKPYADKLLTNSEMHSLEHILATVLRNSEIGEKFIYIGPMGCQTGFYIVVEKISEYAAIKQIKDAFKFIAEGEWDMPGSTPIECGNCTNLDKNAAISIAKEYYSVISDAYMPSPYPMID